MLLIALFVPSNCGGCCTADVDKAPFQVTETGWGEFPLQIKLTFVSEAQEKPLTIVHQLKLHHWVPPPPPGPDGVRLHPFLSDLPSHSARVHLFFFPQPGCSPSLELGQTNAIASLHLRCRPRRPRLLVPVRRAGLHQPPSILPHYPSVKSTNTSTCPAKKEG
jgi:hypothetical protein